MKSSNASSANNGGQKATLRYISGHLLRKALARKRSPSLPGHKNAFQRTLALSRKFTSAKRNRAKSLWRRVRKLFKERNRVVLRSSRMRARLEAEKLAKEVSRLVMESQ